MVLPYRCRISPGRPVRSLDARRPALDTCLPLHLETGLILARRLGRFGGQPFLPLMLVFGKQLARGQPPLGASGQHERGYEP
jgi:hypothetical protein